MKRRRSSILASVLQLKKGFQAHKHLQPPRSMQEIVPYSVHITTIEVQGLLLKGVKTVTVLFTYGDDQREVTTIQTQVGNYQWQGADLQLNLDDKCTDGIISVTLYNRSDQLNEILRETNISVAQFEDNSFPAHLVFDLYSRTGRYASHGQIRLGYTTRGTKNTLTPRKTPLKGSTSSLNLLPLDVLDEDCHNYGLRRSSSFTRELFSEVGLGRPHSKSIPDYAPPVIQVTRTDSSDDEDDVTIVNPSYVVSARGRVNSISDLQDDKLDTETSPTESSEENENTSLDPTAVSNIQSGNIPEEFQNCGKMELISTILNLRNIIQEQDERIQNLQDYIDERLALIISSNPASLELTK